METAQAPRATLRSAPMPRERFPELAQLLRPEAGSRCQSVHGPRRVGAIPPMATELVDDGRGDAPCAPLKLFQVLEHPCGRLVGERLDAALERRRDLALLTGGPIVDGAIGFPEVMIPAPSQIVKRGLVAGHLHASSSSRRSAQHARAATAPSAAVTASYSVR